MSYDSVVLCNFLTISLEFESFRRELNKKDIPTEEDWEHFYDLQYLQRNALKVFFDENIVKGVISNVG